MTRPKLILVPETAVKNLKTIPVATCRTCKWYDSAWDECCNLASPTWDLYVNESASTFACNQWEPKA